MTEFTLVSCYTSFMLFLAYLVLFLLRRERTEFLSGAAFFLSGAIYLLGQHQLEVASAVSNAVSWYKFQHIGAFSYVLTFPLMVSVVISMYLSRRTRIGLAAAAAVMILLLFATDWVITSDTIADPGGAAHGAEGPLYLFFIAMVLGSFVYGYACLIASYAKAPRIRLYLLPGVVAMGLCVIAVTYDLIGVLQRDPPISGVRNLFRFGHFFVSLAMAWALLWRFAETLTALLSSEQFVMKLNRRLQRDLLEFVELISKTLEARDKYTSGHSHRVSEYAVKIGRSLSMSKEQLRVLRQACLLHDIGKIGVPDEVLNKPGKLDKEEYEQVKQHPATGKTILESASEFNDLLSIIYHHHERWDGRGYPEGLVGEDIPFMARIMAVADTFDAITSDRPYRPAYSNEEAVSILKEVKGSQLDSMIVDAFLPIIVAH